VSRGTPTQDHFPGPNARSSVVIAPGRMPAFRVGAVDPVAGILALRRRLGGWAGQRGMPPFPPPFVNSAETPVPVILFY
jgi:hypothetical protein